MTGAQHCFRVCVDGHQEHDFRASTGQSDDCGSVRGHHTIERQHAVLRSTAELQLRQAVELLVDETLTQVALPPIVADVVSAGTAIVGVHHEAVHAVHPFLCIPGSEDFLRALNETPQFHVVRQHRTESIAIRWMNWIWVLELPRHRRTLSFLSWCALRVRSCLLVSVFSVSTAPPRTTTP